MGLSSTAPHRGDEELAKTIAHELGHGMFRLRHTFDSYPSLREGSTANLMDYSKEGTQLRKYQWDYIHHPEAMLGWFQNEEENAYYSLQEVKKLLEEIKQNNEMGKGSVMKASRTIVTAEDLSDEAWLAANMQDKWLSAHLVEDITNDENIRARLKRKPEDYGEDFSMDLTAPVINPATDRHAVLLAKEVEVALDEQTIPVTIHGYAPTDRIFTNYVAQQKEGSSVTLTFFNYEKPKSNRPNRKGLADVSNIRKAFAITVAESSAQTLKDYLNIIGEIDWNVTPEMVESDEIVIEVTRTKSNEFITTGEIAIRGTNIRGATLELGKGTVEEECTPCPDNTAHNCKRVPAGTYSFELNTTKASGKGQHVYHSIRLTDTKGKVVDGHTSKRDGVLIHRGNSYSFIQGCILAMYHDELPNVLSNVDDYLNRDIMGYGVSEGEKTLMPLLIYEYVNKVDSDGIKRKIVTIKDEDGPLTIDTEKFEKRKEAGEYYVSLDIKAKIKNVLAKIAYEVTEDLLAKAGIAKVINEKKIELLRNNVFTLEQKQEKMESLWNDLIAEKSEEVTAEDAAELIVGYNNRFLQLSRASVIINLRASGVENSRAEEVWEYMYDSRYGGSPPGTPFKTNFLGSGGSKWQLNARAIVKKNFLANLNECKENYCSLKKE